MFLPKFYQFFYGIARIYAAPIFRYQNSFSIEEFPVSIWWNPVVVILIFSVILLHIPYQYPKLFEKKIMNLKFLLEIIFH